MTRATAGPARRGHWIPMTVSTPESPTLFDRTLASLRDAMRGLVSSGAYRPAPDLPDPDADILRGRFADCLSARGGEVSARGRAVELGHAYLNLDDTGRRRFLSILAEEFDCDREALDAAAAALPAAPDKGRAAAVAALRNALTPARIRLLRQFNALEDGVKFLVDMRADLLRFRSGTPSLAGMESDLKDLLTGWFDAGFLELRRIGWDAPAALLEKLIAYEAVHEIRDWRDLKNRLDDDRRCYAFFHPSMPDEPLIFVEVALMTGLADNIQALLDTERPPEDPARADTATFYSISNTQRGLAGIALGDFLIKRVVERLRAELPRLRRFATLSPVPGLRRWLAENAGPEVNGALGREGWWRDPGPETERVRAPAMAAAARYLTTLQGDRRALDPVAHFHLSNGARIERVQWLADTSPNGLARSAGVMVNYLYKLDDIEANHESYSGEGDIAASPAIRALLRGRRQPAVKEP